MPIKSHGKARKFEGEVERSDKNVGLVNTIVRVVEQLRVFGIARRFGVGPSGVKPNSLFVDGRRFRALFLPYLYLI